jgi:peptidoglycan L-alanyl-D-glutamate endopeptidase CwlK
MTLGEHQEAFAAHFVELVKQAYTMGFAVRIGEVWRPQEMQELYVKMGRSKTLNSEHLKKCAADLVLLRGGKVCTRQEIKPLGEWWESLDPRNRWGGSWRGLVDQGKSSFVDAPHFERRTGA